MGQYMYSPSNSPEIGVRRTVNLQNGLFRRIYRVGYTVSDGIYGIFVHSFTGDSVTSLG